MELNYVLYASRLIAPLGNDEIIDLLETSRRKNAEAALTGFLQIEDDIVLQYLEGPPQALLETLQRIRKDARHYHFEILTENTLEFRYFDGWQMALVESTTLSLCDLMGVQIKEIPEIKKANPIDLINLLSANASYLRDRPSTARTAIG